MNIAALHFAMGMPQLLEAVMLVCFGVAWPCASLRILRTGQAQSNGLGFTLVILCGYLLGASSKMIVAVRGAELAPVFWLYAVNAVSVGVNLALQVRFGGRLGAPRFGHFRAPAMSEPSTPAPPALTPRLPQSLLPPGLREARIGVGPRNCPRTSS